MTKRWGKKIHKELLKLGTLLGAQMENWYDKKQHLGTVTRIGTGTGTEMPHEPPSV